MHQVPTHVWYSAYGDLTALNIAQNERIRAGLHGRAERRRRAGVGAVAVKLELGDVQGLFARGYGDLKSAAFLLLKVEDAAAARRWLGEASVTITARRTAVRSTRVNVAFTSSGLERLGLPRGRSGEVLERVRRRDDDAAPDADPRRPRRERAGALGLGRPGRARRRGAAPVRAGRRGPRDARGGADPPAGQGGLSRRHGGSTPPTSTASSRSASATGSRSRSSRGSASPARPRQTVRAGEFLLGYENEYGHTIDEPLLHNGSYLVFRQLSQDVGGFWRFVDDATRRARRDQRPGRARFGSRRRWSAAGRAAPRSRSRRTRTIRASPTRTTSPTTRTTPAASRCPVGSHIRRSNPRDSLDPRPGSDTVVRDQPAPPDRAARPRVRAAAAARARR